MGQAMALSLALNKPWTAPPADRLGANPLSRNYETKDGRVLASGPALAKTSLFGGQSGAVQQALVPGVISASAPMKGPSVPKFQREMLLMPQIQPVRTVTETVLGKSATVNYYDVTQKVGSADLLPSPFPRTEIWSYNGIYPGPLFRQTENGAYTDVSHTNELPNPTSTHLHSSPTQPAHDGHPDDLTYKKGTVPPGKLSEFDGGAVYTLPLTALGGER